jgi:DNA polymerase III delta prime subunit
MFRSLNRESLMVNDVELRAKVKRCINTLNPQYPIVFGQDKLVKDGVDESLYVRGLHGGDKDLMRELSDQIDFDEGGGTYLFSGNRGTGKTTELMRLAELLRQQGCEVFYLNMHEYLNLTVRLEITDFLISVLGSFSEKIEERLGKSPNRISFFERIGNFLQSEVKFQGMDFAAGVGDIKTTLKMSLQQDPTFKEKLQEGTRGHVARLVQEARDFVEMAIADVRANTTAGKKIVLIVDSVEQLRGVGDSKDVADIFKSVNTLFSGQADKLRFQSLHLVCTVPPYLSALAGNLAALYSGGKIYMLPSVHVYECCPQDGNPPVQSVVGLNAMLDVVNKRFPEWEEFFTRSQLLRLAANSGGDLRDFFRLVKLCIQQALYKPLPLPDAVIEGAENDLRNDMPLAHDDREWLQKIQKSHQRELDNLDKLPDFARLTENKYILNYRNGRDWFDVHPLLRSAVTDGG